MNGNGIPGETLVGDPTDETLVRGPEKSIIEFFSGGSIGRFFFRTIPREGKSGVSMWWNADPKKDRTWSMNDLVNLPNIDRSKLIGYKIPKEERHLIEECGDFLPIDWIPESEALEILRGLREQNSRGDDPSSFGA